MSDDVRPPRRWVRKVVFGFLILVGVLTLVGWGTRIYLGRVGNERLRAVSAALDAEEPGWRLKDVLARHNAKVLPPDQNAAPVVLKVYDLQPSGWRTRIPEHGKVRPLPPYIRPDASKAEALREHKGPTAEARALARTLRGLPTGHYPIPDAAEVREAEWPHMFKLLDVVKLLQYDGALAGLAGDADGAIEAAHAALNAGRSVGDHPILTAQLARSGCARVAVEAARDALVWGEPARGLAELQAAFAQEADAPRYLYGRRGERAWIDDLFTRFESGELSAGEAGQMALRRAPGAGETSLIGLYRGVAPGDHAECLRVVNEAIAAARLPFDRQLAAFEAIRLPPAALTDLQTPLAAHFSYARDRFARDQLRLRVNLLAASAGIACERFRQARGRWPASLDEIPKDILPAVPTDPFDGRPMRLKPAPDGIAIVVVNHRSPEETTIRPPDDLTAFRLWDPAVRGPNAPPPRPRQPPANPEAKP